VRKILICTTFREFDGGINSQIQAAFLESLLNQTYTNYTLVVTNFKETSVEQYLKKINIDYKFFQSSLEDHRYSWTEVVHNVFSLLETNKNIVLWTNCDNIFSNNFLEEIINNYKKDICGISWPMLSFNSLDDFANKEPLGNEILSRLNEFGEPEEKPLRKVYSGYLYKFFEFFLNKKVFYSYDPKEWISDIIFIDGDSLMNKEKEGLFFNHKLNGRFQGIAQIKFLAYFSSNWVNLIYKTQVASIRNYKEDEKYKNVDIENSSTNKKTESIVDKNNLIIKSFLDKSEMKQSYDRGVNYFAKFNLHKDFKIVGTTKEKIFFVAYLYFWKFYHLLINFSKVGKIIRKFF